jgi:hypothetical protein
MGELIRKAIQEEQTAMNLDLVASKYEQGKINERLKTMEQNTYSITEVHDVTDKMENQIEQTKKHF